ncbi:MAG TPA: 2-dehydropantoate 2-reductase [Solirubrobacteraceae bacterium]|nr:2-dehydropantoate 2-reductase [Solirubrobacteraceae bacterium]
MEQDPPLSWSPPAPATVTRVAVLGAGGVGGFVAAALDRSGENVTVVAREATAATLGDRGLRIRSVVLGEFEARPAVVTELADEIDILFVATKATGLDAGLERIVGVPRVVIPLLNGLEHLDVLRERFGDERVAAAVIRIESDRPAAGEIVQTSPGCRVDLAVASAQPVAVERAAAILERAGIAVRTGAGEATVMWSKLARLCPLALTTSASDRAIGFVRSDPRWRSALEGAINETVRVANADGAGLDPADTVAELAAAPAELGSSMQRDVAAGREPELDAIAGAVLRAGERHGLSCPTVQWLADQVATHAGIPWIV